MPTDLTLTPSTNPIHLYRYRDGLYGVDLLATAIVHLKFFDWLAANPSDLAGICRGMDFAERPADVLLTLCAANGLVENRGGIFHVTETTREHLLDGSPWSLKPYYASLKDRPVCHDYLRVLRTGKPANWGSYKDESDWHKAMTTEPFASQFTAAMDCRGVYLGQALAKKLELQGRERLLDIGGGSGIYACSLVAHHPHLKATVFEQTPVDVIARNAIARRGFSDRVDVVAGEMFGDAYPSGFDVHLLSNVIHDWDWPEARALIAKSFAALPPGGLLILHEAYINREKTGPLPVAEYSALLMHSTQGKCYSVGEMDEALSAAGFVDFHHFDTAADRSAITVRKPHE